MSEPRKKLAVWLSAQADQVVYTRLIVDVPADVPEDEIEELVQEIGQYATGWKTEEDTPAPPDLDTVELDDGPNDASPRWPADCVIVRDEEGKLVVKGPDDK